MQADPARHGFPMPRSAFVLLLLATLLAVLPHLERLPLWVVPALVGILVWRIQVFRQRWAFPGKLVRLLLVLLGFAGVILEYRTVLGPDAGVALLVAAYLFKQLEMITRRDAFLVVILSYFVLATEFLFSNSLYSSLYVLAVLIVITAALVALNHRSAQISLSQPLKTSLLLVGQSLPLMIALFFLFPRIGPLWQLNLHSKQNFVGLSDTMSPGSISELSRSGALAFRAEFQGDLPPMRDRYWRAAVFDRFDGRTWQAALDVPAAINAPSLAQSSRRFEYRVILEPTGQRWLMAIPAAEIRLAGARSTGLLTHVYKNPLDSALAYDVVSYPDYRFEEEGLSPWDQTRYLQLPATGNDASRRYAKQLLAQSDNDPQQMIDRLLHWFGDDLFYYTLKPPLLGANTVDEFLFDTKRGYCAHYAGALVFLLRSAGIPARVVGGYQGGSLHPLGRYLLVHQYDAHAWTEVWLAGKGWVRVDPTAAVAPSRIEEGTLENLADGSFQEESPLASGKLRNLAIFANARLLADYIDYLWFKNVVSYNKEQQFQLFHRLLGQVSPQRIAILLGGIGLLIALFLVGGILLRHPALGKPDAIDRLYLSFCKRLARRGLNRQPGEGPSHFAERACAHLPEQADQIRQITHLYLQLKYMPVPNDGNLIQTGGGTSGTLVRLQKDLQRQVRAFPF